MKNVSSSNGIEKRPKLQFCDANGQLFPAWKQYRFDMLYKPVSEKNDLSYGVENIISVANMYFKPDARISDPEYLRTYNIFKYGDIAFEGNKSKSFANGRLVENTIGDGIVSHVFNVLRPLSSKHNLEYWKYAINNENVMGRILARCTKKTTMMTNLVTADFLKQEICCPVELEQDKIALFLSLIEKRLVAQEQLVGHLKKYKRGVTEAVFKKKICFSGVSESFPDWNTKKIGEICRIQTGKSNTQDELENGRYDFYVRSPIIRKSNRYLFDCEAVLTVGDGVGTGKVFHYVDGKFDLHQRVYAMTNFSDVSGKYFYYYFSHFFYDRVMRMTAKTSVDSVRYEMIEQMDILIPCEKEQNLIVEYLSSLDSLLEHAERFLRLLETLKRGLLLQLFI